MGVSSRQHQARKIHTHMLNKKNDHKGSIVVRGGTFINCDPSNCDDGSFVAEGYQVISEQKLNGDIWYTVIPV